MDEQEEYLLRERMKRMVKILVWVIFVGIFLVLPYFIVLYLVKFTHEKHQAAFERYFEAPPGYPSYGWLYFGTSASTLSFPSSPEGTTVSIVGMQRDGDTLFVGCAALNQQVRESGYVDEYQAFEVSAFKYVMSTPGEPGVEGTKNILINEVGYNGFTRLITSTRICGMKENDWYQVSSTRSISGFVFGKEWGTMFMERTAKKMFP